MPIILYILICFLVGWLGRNLKFGFLFWFVFSLVLTPLVTSLILLFVKTSAAAPQ